MEKISKGGVRTRENSEGEYSRVTTRIYNNNMSNQHKIKLSTKIIEKIVCIEKIKANNNF